MRELRSRKTLVVHVLPTMALLLTFSLVAGCSENGGSGGRGEAVVEFTTAERTVHVERAEELVAVSDDGAIVTVRSDSEIATQADEGDVLLVGITPETPRGLLRRVVSRQVEGETVSLTTEPAALQDAFEELHLRLRHQVDPADLENYDTLVNGLTVRRAPLTIVDAHPSQDFEVSFVGTVLYDGDDHPGTTSDQVVVNGSIRFTLTFDLEVDIGWGGLDRVKVGPRVTEEANIELTGAAGLGLTAEKAIARLHFGGFMVGPVPVTPELKLMLGAEASLSARLTAGITQSLDVAAGAVYANGAWEPYVERSISFEYQPPELSGAATAKAYLGPRLELDIGTVAGPYAQVNGYLLVEVEPTRTPWWQLSAGIEGWVGVQGEIFGLDRFEFRSGDLIGYRKVLAVADGPMP